MLQSSSHADLVAKFQQHNDVVPKLKSCDVISGNLAFILATTETILEPLEIYLITIPEYIEQR